MKRIIEKGQGFYKEVMAMLKMRYFLGMLALFAVLYAQSGPENIAKAMGSLCATFQSVLAIGMLLLVVLAAVVYAVGQILGAETRARASVWATAMFTGAIIGALIYILMPWVLAILLKGEADSTWVQDCCKAEPGEECFGFVGQGVE